MGGVRPERGMGPQHGDPQHSSLLGYIWTEVGLPPLQLQLVLWTISSYLPVSYLTAPKLKTLNVFEELVGWGKVECYRECMWPTMSCVLTLSLKKYQSLSLEVSNTLF